MTEETITLFDEVKQLPDPVAKDRFGRLVGIDETINLVLKMAGIWLHPTQLKKWSEDHYDKEIRIVEQFNQLPHFFVFAGDVGTGKTTLAETFGDKIARNLNIQVTLYRLSLTSRGRGLVGQMTQQISQAIAEVKEAASRGSGSNGHSTRGIIFLIDEADSLVQSREQGQMHHEDRAGVNTIIRGIDDLAASRVPVLVVMCTNRLGAIDPAVRRRAARIFEFARPNTEQRYQLLFENLKEVGFTEMEINKLADATGPNGDQGYGYTYSDLIQQYLPALVMHAVPNKKIEFEDALYLAHQLPPTPPFSEDK